MPSLCSSRWSKCFETGKFQRVPRAVQRTAVNRQDAFRRGRPVDQRLDAATDARETGHFRRAVARELAGDAVGQFARVRTTGAGINHRARLFHVVKFDSRSWHFFVVTTQICPKRRRDDLTQVNEFRIFQAEKLNGFHR